MIRPFFNQIFPEVDGLLLVGFPYVTFHAFPAEDVTVMETIIPTLSPCENKN
jgi:hypothetical protein